MPLEMGICNAEPRYSGKRKHAKESDSCKHTDCWWIFGNWRIFQRGYDAAIFVVWHRKMGVIRSRLRERWSFALIYEGEHPNSWAKGPELAVFDKGREPIWDAALGNTLPQDLDLMDLTCCPGHKLLGFLSSYHVASVSVITQLTKNRCCTKMVDLPGGGWLERLPQGDGAKAQSLWHALWKICWAI